MKRIRPVISIFIAFLVALAASGCKKQTAQPAEPLEASLVPPRAALVKANPDLQRSFYNEVEYGIRYGNYKDALVSLDRLAGDPSLNDQQKKLFAQVAQLLKAKIENPEGGPKPAP